MESIDTDVVFFVSGIIINGDFFFSILESSKFLSYLLKKNWKIREMKFDTKINFLTSKRTDHLIIIIKKKLKWTL